MKLSDIKGDRALDVIAELIEPVTVLAADEKVAELFKGVRAEGEDNKAYTLRKLRTSLPWLIKSHKAELIQVFAALDGVSPVEYQARMTLLTLPKQLLDILGDREFIELFTSAAQTEGQTSAGSTSAIASAD